MIREKKMKHFMITILIVFASVFSQYNVGDTVLPEDNLSWTDDGGLTTSVFGQTSQLKAVFLFMGQTW